MMLLDLKGSTVELFQKNRKMHHPLYIFIQGIWIHMEQSSAIAALNLSTTIPCGMYSAQSRLTMRDRQVGTRRGEINETFTAITGRPHAAWSGPRGFWQ